MKNFLFAIFVLLTVLGWATLGFSTVISIGYCLYLWGSVGTILSSSAWAAFVLWVKMFGGGIIILAIGIAGGKLSQW